MRFIDDSLKLLIFGQFVLNVLSMQLFYWPERLGIRIHEDLPHDTLDAHIMLALMPTIPLMFWRSSRVATLALREKEKAEAEARHIARHDPLTGIGNRRLFAEVMDCMLSQIDRPGLAVMLLDLDGFKQVNDSYGHAAGDTVLQVVAQRLKGITDDQVICTRMGGDEFAVIPPAVSDTRIYDAACTLAQTICEAVRQPIKISPSDSARVSASIGVAITEHRVDPSDLLRAADRAMYRVKQHNKNGWDIEIIAPTTAIAAAR